MDRLDKIISRLEKKIIHKDKFDLKKWSDIFDLKFQVHNLQRELNFYIIAYARYECQKLHGYHAENYEKCLFEFEKMVNKYYVHKESEY